MAQCDFKEVCSFYRERKASQSLTWEWLIKDYCMGSLYPMCEIRTYFLDTGEGAPEGLMPSGEVDDDLVKLK